VTVCIAALPRFTDRIILVSDQLLSSDEASVDGVMKFATIAPGTEWYVMCAGDPSRFLMLMDTVRQLFGDVKNKRLTVEAVTACFEHAYRLELLKLTEAAVLRPYGLRHADFIKKGKRLLGELRFSQVLDQVEAVDLGVEVLVAGLDAWGQTRLFSATTRGLISPAALPYHAIGAGASVALGSLYPLKFFPTVDQLPETVYRVCAAKFAAEHAPSVGESTYAVVISPMAGTWTLVFNIDRIRELWRTKGQPPVPAQGRRSIERDLRSLMPRLPKTRKRGGRLTRS
jgi:hypothetical protein